MSIFEGIWKLLLLNIFIFEAQNRATGNAFEVNPKVAATIDVLRAMTSSWRHLAVVHEAGSEDGVALVEAIASHSQITLQLLTSVVQLDAVSDVTVRQALARLNPRQPQAVIVAGSADTVVTSLRVANNIDATLDQQAYFTFVYHWIVLPQASCDVITGAVHNITHVLCIDEQNKNSDTEGKAGVRTAMWGVDGRYWDPVQENETKKAIDKFFPNTNFGLNGRHMLLGSMFWPGYLERRVLPSGKTLITGMLAEMAADVAKYINFTYEIVIPADGMFGSINRDGSWTGIVGQVFRKEVDFSFAALATSTLRKTAMDFADVPLQQTYVTGIYQKPKPETNTMNVFLLPFQRNVWVLIFVAIASASVTLATIEILNPKRPRTAIHSVILKLYSSFEYCLATLVTQSQSKSHETHRTSARLVVAAHCSFALLLVTLWTGDIISYLSVNIESKPIVTLQDMLEQSEFKYGLLRGSFAYDNLRKSRQPRDQQIWKNVLEFSKGDEMILSDKHDVNMERVRQGGFVYITEYDVLAKAEAQECDLTTMREPLYPMSYPIGLQKNSAYRSIMNRISRQLIEAGVKFRLFNQHFLTNISCTDTRLFTTHQPVRLPQMTSVFTVLGVSVIIAMTTLCGEMIISIVSRLTNRKRAAGH